MVPEREGKRAREREGSVGKLTARSIWMEEGRERELDGGAELLRDRQWRPRRHRPIRPGLGAAELREVRSGCGVRSGGSGREEMRWDGEGRPKSTPVTSSARRARPELEKGEEGDG